MNLEPFLYWCNERESIRIKKERGDPPPWTSDEIIATHRWCNVRREDDKVTRWIAKHIREPYADHPNLWLMLCAARWINVPETLGELIVFGAWPQFETFRPEDMTAVLEARKGRREKTFTGAYILRSKFGMSKAKCIAEITLGNLWRDRATLAPKMKGTLQEAHEALTAYPYWGNFMAYQAVVDMRFCDRLLAQATDRHKWASAGPGTLRGLNRLHERPVDYRLSQSQALTELLEFYALLKREIRVKIDLSDVPNICCETDKYLRLKGGEGSVRARYNAGEAYARYSL